LKAKTSPNESEDTTRARERLLCYYVQHLIQQQWPVLNGNEDRVKDYIRFPKPNGYQSLHYTASLTYHTGQEFPFEVQVRSEEMHRIAEYGVAAHWDYKLATKAVATTTTAGGDQAEDATPTLDLETLPVPVIDADVEKVETTTTTEPEYTSSAEKGQTDNVDKPAELVQDEVVSSRFTPGSLVVNERLLSTLSYKHGSAVETKESNKEGSPTASGKTSKQLDYIDALVTARQSLVRDRVYVFVAGAASLTMEQGQLVILDSGSSIRDALDHHMKESSPELVSRHLNDNDDDCDNGDNDKSVQPEKEPTATATCRMEPRVWKNGQLAGMEETIRNGDVLLLEL